IEEKATVAGKVMFVCASREIAYKLFKEIIRLRPEWNEQAIAEHLSEKEQKEIKPIERIKMVMTRSKDDEESLWNLLGTKEDRKELDRQFKQKHSNFKIAIVVDMWLTGFDVPFLDTIYIDKPLQTHNLIQTISRVNRKFEGKDKGLVVDYIGIKKNLNHALGMFNNTTAADDFEDIDKAVIIVKDQLELLRQFFYQFDKTDYFTGSPIEQLNCLNRASEVVLMTEQSEKFFVDVTKKLKAAYNLTCSAEIFNEKETDEIHFYFAIKSIVVKLTKGEAPDTAQMNAKVSKMVEEAIVSEGVEEIFKLDDNKANAIDLFNDKFLEKIDALELPNTKIKILERLLKQAISDFKKVNKVKGIEFSERLQKIINIYNERSELDILDYDGIQADTSEQILDLILKLRTEMASFEDLGIDYEEKAFYDILDMVCKQYGFEFDKDKMLELAREIKRIVDDTARFPDWSDRDDIKAQLKMEIIVKLHQFGYPPITQDEVYKNVLEQAENFKRNR
ncbi:type I restriction enzyme endonuclease domain-containing protein, partial [Kaistella sp.]|uniref:type I restriction enzyme endonuclease domain-containing protein n=1 Tax=Kaistella sp. TaxID=2782235 RepID=UPI002F930672